MNTKTILKNYWMAVDGYDGEIKITKTKKVNDCQFYDVETEGNEFEVAHYTTDGHNNYVFVRSAGADANSWKCTNGAPVIQWTDGTPKIPPIM